MGWSVTLCVQHSTHPRGFSGEHNIVIAVRTLGNLGLLVSSSAHRHLDRTNWFGSMEWISSFIPAFRQASPGSIYVHEAPRTNNLWSLLFAHWSTCLSLLAGA